MEYAAEEKIRNALSANERLVWSGRPRQGFLLRRGDEFAIPFSLIWGGFALCWEASAVAMGAPLLFWIWGLPFLAAGFYMVLGRFLVDVAQRRKTYYGVTTERIVIISGFINPTVKSLAIKTLGDISLAEQKNQEGTITFGPTGPGSWRYSLFRFPGMGDPIPTFEAIPNAKEVYDQIRSIQNE